MTLALMEHTFTSGWSDRDTAVAAYQRHNEQVRAEAPSDRLIDWQPGDGWEPLCSALGVAVPRSRSHTRTRPPNSWPTTTARISPTRAPT